MGTVTFYCLRILHGREALTIALKAIIISSVIGSSGRLPGTSLSDALSNASASDSAEVDFSDVKSIIACSGGVPGWVSAACEAAKGVEPQNSYVRRSHKCIFPKRVTG